MRQIKGEVLIDFKIETVFAVKMYLLPSTVPPCP